jgi:hypothetical protein
MHFDEIRNGGCVSYLIGCERTCAALVVDPVLEQHDRYLTMSAAKGARIQYLLDTHTLGGAGDGSRPSARSSSIHQASYRRSPRSRDWLCAGSRRAIFIVASALRFARARLPRTDHRAAHRAPLPLSEPTQT